MVPIIRVDQNRRNIPKNLFVANGGIVTIMKIKTSERIAQLQRENKELSAQLVHQYHFASIELKDLTIPKMTGSAVILELTTLGGKRSVGPVAIRDGLSDETIAAIKADLVRSFNLCTELKP